MSLLLFDDVLNFRLVHFTSTDRASFLVGNLVMDCVTILVLRKAPRHEPIPVNANDVESVVALIDSNEIDSVCEALPFLFPFLTELFEAHCASTLHCIVVLCQNFSHLLMQIVYDTGLIFVFLSGLSELL